MNLQFSLGFSSRFGFFFFQFIPCFSSFFQIAATLIIFGSLASLYNFFIQYMVFYFRSSSDYIYLNNSVYFRWSVLLNLNLVFITFFKSFFGLTQYIFHSVSVLFVNLASNTCFVKHLFFIDQSLFILQLQLNFLSTGHSICRFCAEIIDSIFLNLL